MPLRSAAPGVFGGLTQRYGALLDLALEQRAYKVEHGLPSALRALADELGRMRAGPRDVIELHSTALRGRTVQARSRKAQAYVEEAHVMVLELMGYLAAFYRRQALLGGPGATNGASAPPSSGRLGGSVSGAQAPSNALTGQPG